MKKNAPQRRHHRSDLLRLAKQAMTDHGLQPEFSASVEEQVAGLHEAAHESGPDIRDLRHLLWCSLDNDDSRDLDQLTVCELLPDGTRKMRVAIADVDALVKKAARSTTTPNSIPPPFTPRRRFFRCCPNSYRPI